MNQSTSTAQEVSDLLRSEHHKVEEMMTKVMDTEGAARDAAFGALLLFLASHEAAEETFVHPRISSAVTQERVNEEEEAGELIARLEAMDSSTKQFDEVFAQLAASVKEHAKAEEHQELPEVTRDASPEELGRMFDALSYPPAHAIQQGGPIDAGTDFASMLARAKAQFSALSSQFG